MTLHIDLTITSPFAAPLVAVLISFLFWLTFRKFENEERKTPPGETGLPWIGETMEWYRAQIKNRVFEDFIRPRVLKHGATFKTRLMGSPTVIVNGSQANRFFLSNEFKLVVSSWPSSSVQLMGRNSIMEMTGDQHRCIRGILTPCLGTVGLEPLLPVICRVVKAHLTNHWGGQGENVITLYRSAKLLSFTVMCECMLEMEAHEGIFHCFEKVLEGVFSPPVNLPGTSFWRAKRARAEIERVLINVVRKKRQEMEAKDDGQSPRANSSLSLLSRLVGALIRGEMTEVEVVDNVVLLIFAAHDTTSFAIAMTFKMMAQHPDSYAQLLQEHMDIKRNRSRKEGEDLRMEDLKKMKYTWQVVRETIRLFPPIFGSFRRAIQDIEFDGYIIPKGWKVLWTAYGTHYSEEYFGNPERFDPTRFEEGGTDIPAYAYVPFGGGPRMCAGYHLAKLNILTFLHFVVTSFNWSLVNPDEPIIMDPLPFPSLGMPIHISPKHPLV